MHADSTSSDACVRAGGTVLSLLAVPLSVPILRAHREGPLRLPDLRERIGGAAQTTLRGQVSNLRGIGALERTVLSGMPYTVVNGLTPVGERILEVADLVEAWLARAPQGPIVFGSESAKAAIRSLVGGWDSGILRALAAEPLSLTELSSTITDISYPSLERRLSAMRATGQVEQRSSETGQAKPNAVTEWTRQAVASLVAAGRCEHEHFSDTTQPMTRADVEAAFLLAVPMVELADGHRGSCLFAVDTGGEEAQSTRLAGVHVAVEENRVVVAISGLEQDPQAWALGTVRSWTDAIVDGCQEGLRLGGDDRELVEALITGLHGKLAAAG